LFQKQGKRFRAWFGARQSGLGLTERNAAVQGDGNKALRRGGLFEDDPYGKRRNQQFKKDFGGQQVRTYDCTVPVTLKRPHLASPSAMPGGVENPRTLKQRLQSRPDCVDRPKLPAKHDPVFRPQGHLGDNAPSLTAGSWDPARRRKSGSTLTVLFTIVGLTSTTPF